MLGYWIDPVENGVVPFRPNRSTITCEDAVKLAKRAVPVNVGPADKTLLPVPVDEVTPVPPFATGNAVPDKPIARVPDATAGLVRYAY